MEVSWKPKSGEKRDEAKVGDFSRLLEAIHRFDYSKDDVGLAGDEGLVLRKGRRLRRERTAEEN